MRAYLALSAALFACGAPSPQVAPDLEAPAIVPKRAPVSPARVVRRVDGECPPERGKACWTSADGFRFLHPSPTGAVLRDVKVMPDGEVWIVGDHATLIRIVRGENGARRVTRVTVPDVPTLATVFDEIDGAGTSVKEFPGSQYMPLDFDAVIANASDDVWIAVGERQLAHWDGHVWRHHAFGGHSGGGEAIMFGPGGKLWSTGATAPAIFKEQQSPLLLDVRRPDGAFDEGPVIPSRGHMRTIAWQGDEVWVAGFYDNIFRSRAGGPFQAVAMPEKNESYEAMWLDELGSAGYLIADRALYERTKDGFKHAHKLAGSASDVHSFRGGNPTWVVGEWAWRYDKGKLQEVPIEGFVPPRHYVLSLGANRIEAVDARSPDDVWMVGRSGLILHYDGKALRELFPLFTEEDFVGVQWIGADTWLAASDDGALIAGSLATGVTDHQKAPLESPRALSKTLAGEVILAGCRTDMFARESNGAWTKLPKLDGCVNDVHGKDREHLWAVGSRDLVDGKAWRLDGGRWIEIPTGMGEHDDLRDVEVAPNGDVWLAGNGFLFRARAGGALVRVAKHEYDDYRQVVVRKPDDVWIATDANEIGSAGTLLHFNGKGFERFDHLTTNFLYSVIALPSGEVWAVGLGGVAAYSRDGKTFRPVQTGTDVTLSYLLAHPSGALLAVGDNGAILQRDAR